MAQKNNKKRKPLVSVLICTYNAENFIEPTLSSIVDQTYNNLEILILDNNSQDKTLSLIENFKRKDKRIEIFKSKKNLGAYKGLNFLLERASGDYIAIQDHDDIWFPTKLNKQISFLEKNPSYIGIGSSYFKFFEEENLFLKEISLGDTSFVAHTSLVFRNKKLFYDPSYTLADEHFQKKKLLRKGKLYCLEEPLIIYRKRKAEKNLSACRFKPTLKNIREFVYLNGLNIPYFINLISKNCLARSLLQLKKNILFKKEILLTKEKFLQKYPYMRKYIES